MQLNSYYCICGEFILVIDKPLSYLPRRRTDDSYIITHTAGTESTKRNFKLNGISQTPCMLQREDGMCERQHRLSCPRCTIVVAYTHSAPLFLSKQDIRLGTKEAEYVYILKGALSDIQGSIPNDALEEFSGIKVKKEDI
ncbi:hypothetical protein E3Q22_00818 [Wallemia mellicola]|uniref:STEEP1 domain-containing protein n=1 Tax=Wallemia mellicola TaxID=1708541 RepID=A0A4V4N4D8_9BASI|nr:hypothetical protein E3Q24_00511 [Wallemia mellicola]TIB79027.1 hypothetical protein E3Q23_00546 [Wallemia mellicola]TIB81819.1 hypothetical protein E3Q22_00818 [Wallemia mellicola]TIB89932.1 hypothetical protein E3Q21_00378 [Wallemia mellicola]TIB92461.1 hypothetical protein E3Q20_00302 [Wallemia mellicola]